MPPKKANTKAKATPARAAAPADPGLTVTNAKGKEIETTAAAGRPRRTSGVVDAPAPRAKKAATTKAASAKKAALAKKAETKPATGTTS